MYRATVSFSGVVSMAMGEVREILDESIAKDLLNAGYIEEIKEERIEQVKTVKKKRTAKTK